jgi:hypothetical protein
MAEPVETLDAEVMAEFGGELRRFRLTVPFLAKVERDCDAGPAVIAGALAHCTQMLQLRAEKKLGALALMAAGLGDWRAAYVTRTLFWALNGGGMDPNLAGRLIREHIEERGFTGLLENAELAFGVITGAYMGPADDRVGESARAAATAPTPTPTRSRSSRTGARATAPSTA